MGNRLILLVIIEVKKFQYLSFSLNFTRSVSYKPVIYSVMTEVEKKLGVQVLKDGQNLPPCISASFLFYIFARNFAKYVRPSFYVFSYH